MAVYIRRDRKGDKVYYRVVESFRVGKKVIQRRIKGLASGAIHVQVDRSLSKSEALAGESMAIGPLATELAGFIKTVDTGGLSRKRLLRMGEQYLSSVLGEIV